MIKEIFENLFKPVTDDEFDDRAPFKVGDKVRLHHDILARQSHSTKPSLSGVGVIVSRKYNEFVGDVFYNIEFDNNKMHNTREYNMILVENLFKPIEGEEKG